MRVRGGWSRRAVLQSVPAALGSMVGCPSARPTTPTLAFVGPDPERGHVLRAAAASVEVPAVREGVGVVIVGAGVAGLTAAWRLHREGFTDVRVLELEDAIGGTARWGTLPRSPYPMGAHYLPVPHASFVALQTLLEDLGLVVGHHADGTPEYDPRAVVRAPLERHRHRGLWHEGLYPASGADAAALAEFERFRQRVRELDRSDDQGRRLFDLPLWRSSPELRSLDALTMAQWLDREGFADWRVRWLCDYGCRDDYGCTIEQASAFAGLHHFVARGVEDERDRMLLSWPQGNGALCERMAARIDLGDRLHTGVAVLRIDPENGTVVAWNATTGATSAYQADVILWAAPRFVLRHVLPPGRDPLAPDVLTYTPWLVANVEVARPPTGTGAPLSWDNVEVGGDHLGYVVANHLEDLVERRQPGAVLTYYEPWPADDLAGLDSRRAALLSATLGELAEHVITQLTGMHGTIAADVRSVHICRWGHAMVRPTPGALFSPAAQAARAPIGRVVPCAADVGGLPLFEQAFALGVAAGEHALTTLGHRVTPMIPT